MSRKLHGGDHESRLVGHTGRKRTRGEVDQRFGRRRTHKHGGSKREVGETGEQWNGIPTIGPLYGTSACSVGSKRGHTI